MKNFIFALVTLLVSASSLSAEIIKLDEEDLRALRASDPTALLMLPPQYAFSQAAQTAAEQGYRYFSLVFYDCTLGENKTSAQFQPSSTNGVLLEYKDEWILVEFYAYFDDPGTVDVIDAFAYTIYLCEHEIDLYDGFIEE